MALVVHFDLELYQMNVKTVFLNESLNEEIYIEQIECYSENNKSHLVCKFKKSKYRFKQAFR